MGKEGGRGGGRVARVQTGRKKGRIVTLTSFHPFLPPLVHDKAGARALVRVFVSDIGETPLTKPIPEPMDCSISPETVWRQLTEIW